MGRLAASLGALTEVSPIFQTALDISFGGVLLALPALLACGLLKEVAKHFRLPKGYYGLKSLFLLLAFMALARIKTIENLRYCAPGEWGKLLGLDFLVRGAQLVLGQLCTAELLREKRKRCLKLE